MHSRFSELPIEAWIHRGQLGKSTSSLCLYRKSADLGAPIDDALNELGSSEPPQSRSLRFAQCQRHNAISLLQLRVVPPSSSLQVMKISFEAKLAIVEMTEVGLRLMIQAVERWLSGAEDFSVSPQHAHLKKHDLGTGDRDSAELWFWGPGYHGP